MNTNKSSYRLIAGLCFVISLSFWGCYECKAQRTMNDRNLLTGEYAAQFSSVKDFGINLSWGRYLLDGFWNVSASGVSSALQLSTGDRLGLITLRAEGGYLHRIASTRSRGLNLYAGGNAFIGYEVYDPWDRLPANINTGLGTGAFIYGIRPRLEAEVFITKRLAIVISGSAPLTFGSVSSWLRGDAGVGLRVNI